LSEAVTAELWMERKTFAAQIITKTRKEQSEELIEFAISSLAAPPVGCFDLSLEICC
jgi:hypothetical protein